MAMFGTLFGGNQAQEARRAQRRQEAIAGQQGALYTQYASPAMAALASLAGVQTPGAGAGATDPSWMNTALRNSRAEVERGTERYAGNVLNRAAGSGMLDSGQTANILASIGAHGNEQLLQSRERLGEYSDERQRALLQALLAMLSGAGSQASAGYGQAAAGYGSDTGLMGLLGGLAGGWAGGGFR
jgi:hypothetical protein